MTSQENAGPRFRRIVFVRCGWAERYDGTEVPDGGGSYNTTKLGHERFNFKAVGGRVYGYFQPQAASGGFNLARIDPTAPGVHSIDGVTVVFVATHPSEGGQRVVGWYRDATAFATRQSSKGLERKNVTWQMSARAENAVLLPSANRLWSVPTGAGGMKQTMVRYPVTQSGQPDLRDWMREIAARIDGYSGPNLLNAQRSAEPVAPASAVTTPQSWRIKDVEIRNFRLIEHLKLPLDPRLTLLVGDNGNGKTSILDAIRVGLAEILKRAPNVRGTDIVREDMRVVGGKLAPMTWIRLETRGGVAWDRQRERDKSPGTAAEITALVPQREGLQVLHRAIDPLFAAAQQGEEPSLPLPIYYGTERTVSGASPQQVEGQRSGQQLLALDGALDLRGHFQDFFNWFMAAESEELRTQRDQRDFQVELPALGAVRRAIRLVIPGASEIKTTGSPTRLVIKLGTPHADEELEFSQLSGGYRAMLAMVGDLARRLVQANPSQGLASEAVVLIDEIDLHLHPRWQQTVVPGLLAAFPNTQFVITTHSEQVVASVQPEHVRMLTVGNGTLTLATPTATYGATADRVLRDVLGLEHDRAPIEVREALDEYWRLIQQNEGESAQALGLRMKLDGWFQGLDTDLVRADIELRRRRFLAQRQTGAS